jgi:hypothetical protein
MARLVCSFIGLEILKPQISGTIRQNAESTYTNNTVGGMGIFEGFLE